MDPMMGYNNKASKNRFFFFRIYMDEMKSLFYESKSPKKMPGTLIIPTETPFSFCMLRVPLRFFG